LLSTVFPFGPEAGSPRIVPDHLHANSIRFDNVENVERESREIHPTQSTRVEMMTFGLQFNRFQSFPDFIPKTLGE